LPPTSSFSASPKRTREALTDIVSFIARLAFAKDGDPLEKLPYAEHATFNHYSRGTDSLCLPNMRVQVLQDIMA
jgi:hypothetical protein